MYLKCERMNTDVLFFMWIGNNAFETFGKLAFVDQLLKELKEQNCERVLLHINHSLHKLKITVPF